MKPSFPKRSGLILKRWPLLLFIAVVLFTGVTAWHYSGHILDSDASSELVLGRLLAEQNRIVTADWLYGHEIRLFNSNLVYMPLFKIFTDWQTVRFISILLFQLLLALSYYYLSRRMKISRNAYFLSASLMLLPLSIVYGRLGLYHNYYTCCFIYGFLIVGLYLSFLEHQGGKRLWQALRLFAMLLLSLISCMNGFRQLPGTMIPLLMTALAVAFKEGQGEPDTIAENSRHRWRYIALAGAIFAAGVAGLYIHTYILPRYFSFVLKNNSVIALPSAVNLRNLLVGYLNLFGFQEGRTLFTAANLLALGGVFAAIVLLVVSLRELVSRKQPIYFADTFMGAFYPVAMLCMTLIFLLVLGNENYPQYYLPAFVWIFPYLGLLLDRIPKPIYKMTIKQMIVALACLCLLFNGLYNNRFFIKPDGKQVLYDSRIDIHALDRLDGAIRFINENKLDVGYADFWDAGIVTEATDGRVPIISLSYDIANIEIAYTDVLTNLRYREKAFVNDQSVFLLLSARIADFFGETDLAQRATLAYEDADYQIYTFDSPTAVWEYLNQ